MLTAARRTRPSIRSGRDAQAETARLVALLEEAAAPLPSGVLRTRLRKLTAHLCDPTPIVGIAGRLNTGKSTLSNGITGGLAATAPTECTLEPGRYRRESGRLRCTTVDTPGSDSVRARGGVSLTALGAVDLLLYVVVTPTGRDVSFLDALYQTRAFSPANVILVVNRIDERVPEGRDPWPAAAEVSDSFRRRPELRALMSFPVVALLAETSVHASLTEDDLDALREGQSSDRLTRLLGAYGRSMLVSDPVADLAAAHERLAELSRVGTVLTELTARCGERAKLRLVNSVRRLETLVESAPPSAPLEAAVLDRIDNHLTRLRRTSPLLLIHDVEHALSALADRPGLPSRLVSAYLKARDLLRSGAPQRTLARTAEPLGQAARSDDRSIARPSAVLRHHINLMAHEESPS